MSRHPRRKLLLVASLFFAPLVLAYLLYFTFPEWQPRGKVHHGELIDPARPVPAALQAPLRGKWSFVYLGLADCAQACRETLYQARQIRTLLNEKRQRVQRVYVAPDATALERARAVLAPDHPDLVFIVEGAASRAFFGAHDPQALYLTDPLGNWLMAYPGGSAPAGILADIKRLLRISQIG